MDYGLKILNEYLKEFYKNSIDLKDYNDPEKRRIERFTTNLKDYYMDMIVNNYIDEDNYNYYLAKLMCLDFVEINIDEINKVNALSYYSCDNNSTKIVTSSFNNDVFEQRRGIYIPSRDFEKIIDYHELTHVLLRGLSSRAEECASRIRSDDGLTVEDFKLLKEKITLALKSMNEYTAEYVSNDLVIPAYKNRNTLIFGDSHFMGRPYESHLLNYKMLEPLVDASANLIFSDEKNKDAKRRKFSEIILKYDPTLEFESLVDREKEIAIYDAFASTMVVLNTNDNKINNFRNEAKALKKLKRMK